MPVPKTSITPRLAGRVLTIPTTSALSAAVTLVNITWTGLETDMQIVANFNALPVNVAAFARIASKNTVTVALINPTAGNISVAGASVDVIAL